MTTARMWRRRNGEGLRRGRRRIRMRKRKTLIRLLLRRQGPLVP